MSSQPIATQNQPITFADRALVVTKYGVPVMPVKPRDKKTVLKDWPNQATTDIAQITKWSKENPDYNCGAVGRKGEFWIFDADRFVGLSEQIERETGHHLDAIDTLMVKSSEGKLHIYFKHDVLSEALGNFSVDDANGEVFSVRAHNAYVVAPGSIHPKTGLPYEVINEPTFGDIPPAPNWLIDWLFASKTSSAGGNTTQIPKTIPEHARNKTLTSLAGTMRRKGATENAILAALRVTNQQCAVPLPESELATIAGSIAKYPPAEDAIRNEAGKPSRPSKSKSRGSDIQSLDGEAVSRMGDGIPMKRIKWLWQDRIPLGKITLFAGNPDNGKSLAVNSIAAICTTGRDFPDSPNTVPPSDVLMMLGEDDLEDTAIPRLVAAGADMHKIHFLESVKRPNADDTELRLDIDLPVIETQLNKHPNIRVIVIDPISNYLGGVSMVAEQDVRSVLIPLKKLAERHSVALIFVMHLNKKSELDAISRVGGAMAFIGVARCSWLFARDEPNEDGSISDRFTMSRIKNNLAAATHGGLAFQIKTKEIPMPDAGVSWEPYIEWGGVVHKSANDALGTNRSEGRPKGTDSKLQTAIGFVQEILATGPRDSKEVLRDAKEMHGLSLATLRRAYDQLHAVTTRGKGEDAGKYWVELPKDSASGDSEPDVAATGDGGVQTEFSV
jgi:putative DNA primase/helicase